MASVRRAAIALSVGLLAAPVAAIVGTASILALVRIMTPESMPSNLPHILLLGLIGGSVYAAPATLLGLPIVALCTDARQLKTRAFVFFGCLFGGLSMGIIVALTRKPEEAIGGTALGIMMVGALSGAIAGLMTGLALRRAG